MGQDSIPLISLRHLAHRMALRVVLAITLVALGAGLPTDAAAGFSAYDGVTYGYEEDRNFLDARSVATPTDCAVAEELADGSNPHLEMARTELSGVVAPRLTDDIIGAACSFSGDTGVLMADGTTKPIEEIKVGDRVLAADPETGQRGAREVTYLWAHQDTIVDLEISGHDVATTEDHPFWNHTDNEWQRADALDQGDSVLTADGDVLAVTGLDRRSARTELLCAQAARSDTSRR